MSHTLYLLVCLCVTTPKCFGTSSRDLASLQAEFFAWQMEINPIAATYRDIHKYNDQLKSYNMTMMNDNKLKADQFHARLKAIQESELNCKKDVINYKILDDMLSTYIDGYQWRFYQALNPVTFREGPQNGISSMVQAFPFFTHGDFENYIVRLTKFPKQYKEYEALMREAIRLNRTNHNHSMLAVDEQFERLQVAANMSAFYWPFTDTLDNSTIEEGARTDIRSRGMAAVTIVLAALKVFQSFIREEYMPKTRPEIGISSLDGGMEYYEACIRWYLSENRTANEVHDIGLKEVDRIVANMQVVMKKQGFEGTPGEYYRQFLNDSRFVFENAEDLLTEVRKQIFDIIDPKLDGFFSNNPNLPLEVHAMVNDGPRGSYSSGSADGTRPGIFWANTHRPLETLNFTLMPLTIHEANPGHHFQISTSLTSDTPDFRQKMVSPPLYRVPYVFPRYTAYVEGWALYTEFLGEEMDLYRDDYELMGRYSDEMFRACRLVVDTGIHAFNWTREDAIDYFLRYTAQTYDGIAVEIDRYITWPGQALAYKMGEIKIKELRARAEQRLGARFDIREFHSVVLESGTVPLNVLEDFINDWLDSYPTSPPGTDSTTVAVTCGTAILNAIYLWPFLVAITVFMAC